MYTNHFNWLIGLMITLMTDVCLITTGQSFLNVLVNIYPHFIPGNPSIQTLSPEVDELGEQREHKAAGMVVQITDLTKVLLML